MEKLQGQYSHYAALATRLSEAVVTQIGELLNQEQIGLGVPIESRVKSWNSIAEKLERKQLEISCLAELDDLVGVRLILLFREDLTAVETLVRKTFNVVSSEDTGSRLGESQFGYQSRHYVVTIPKGWGSVPTMAGLDGLRVELQVRTLAQHIWAAASHQLQYKHEASVPPPVRRAIHRVSALLETVDLEFDRILAERRQYVEVGIPAADASEPLNVDLLAALLNELLPGQNRREHEQHEELLSNLRALSIVTAADLRALVSKHLEEAVNADHRIVRGWKKKGDGYISERTGRGVFYTHVGLVREMLRNEFGENASRLFRNRARPKAH